MSSERLFTALKDGVWHNLNELAQQLGIYPVKLEECARDLRDKGIVEYEEDTKKIKIEPKWVKLLPDETHAQIGPSNS